MIVRNYDEVDFTVQPSESPAFMHVGLSGSGDVAIEIAVVDSPQLSFPPANAAICKQYQKDGTCA